MKRTGDVLRLLRQQKSWSQEDVAHELNMSLTGYSKIERNITDITLSRIIQLAEIFGIRPYELLAMSEDNNVSAYEKMIEAKDKEIMKLQQKVIELMEK
jgi:transcriptional regulator with XRE-family HTH domain